MSTAADQIPGAKLPGTSVPDPAKIDAVVDPHRRWTGAVAVWTAVLAAAAAISSALSTSHINRAMVEQINTGNQWAWYQAKGVKKGVIETRLEVLGAGASTTEHYKQLEAKLGEYDHDLETIRAEAETHQKAADDHLRRHKNMSQASSAFQIAIALSAIALLTKRNVFWFVSMGIGVVGAVFLTMALV